MRRLLFAFSLFVPVVAIALDYSDQTGRYSDAPFRTAEGAGISLLTSIGAVEGNPDGSFQPDRSLNRAEFLKIVLASHPAIRPASSDAEACFPDVTQDAWYSRYVCLAKRRGIVGGYPDGTFRPAQSVNYAEALKMLSELYAENFGVEVADYQEQNPEPWYAAYARIASDRELSLPTNPSYDHFLTRGEMARLAAAYRAESEGELALYRSAEAGEVITSSSSSVTSSGSSTSSSVSSSSSSISSSSSASSAPVTTSHQLLIGTRPSVAVADGTFTTSLSNATIRLARVELEDEVDSLQSLRLVDAAGREIGTLEEDKYDSAGTNVWEGSFSASGAYAIPVDTPVVLYLQAVLDGINTGGKAAELLEIDTFSITVTGGAAAQSQQLIPTVLNTPVHQTVLGHIRSIQNANDATGTITSGNDRLLAAFSFTGSSIVSTPPAVASLLFDHLVPPGVTINNLEIGRRGTLNRHPCAFSTADRRFQCIGLPVDMARLSSPGMLTLELYADLTFSNLGAERTIQFSLGDAGTVGRIGAVSWTDGNQPYNWLDLPSPLAVGTSWTIAP